MNYRYFIFFAYDGTNYCGWQIQPNGISIQEVLKKSLSTILREPIDIVGAGRTDAGVHAKNMAAHFNTTKPIANTTKLISNLNSLLPNDIAISDIKQTTNEAHARFDAISRKYEYHIVLKKSPFDYKYAYRQSTYLDIEQMNIASKILFEYTDFTSFSKLHTDTKTNNCTIYHAEWIKVNDDKIIFTIEANRFLRNMVRAIVGTLLDVGRHKINITEFRKIIETKNRCAAGHSVAASGLYFIEAKYHESIYDINPQYI